MRSEEAPQILTNDFDALVSEVAIEIWNTLIHQSSFDKLMPTHYVDLLDATHLALKKYRAERG